MLTQERLKEILYYDQTSGNFTWILQIAKKCKVGNVAGSLNGGDGYVYVRIFGHRYAAHRLAWFYMTGKWPANEVDHRDTVRNNNCWENLRSATRGQNAQNQRKAWDSNKAGFLGVYYVARDQKFYARIQTAGKRRGLGYYDAPELAHEAYLKAKRQYHEFGTL